MKRVVLYGARSAVLSQAARSLTGGREPSELVLIDEEPALRRVEASLPGGAFVEVHRAALSDRERLRYLLAGADLVVNGAGPFANSTEVLLPLAIEARVDYLDVADDVAATRLVFAADRVARAVGVNLLTGCGAAPGLTNVLVRELAGLLDEVQEADVAFCRGAEPGPLPGPPVVDHVLTMVTGGAVTAGRDQWAAEERQPSPRLERMPFAFPLGNYPVWEVPHPETISLPRLLPSLRRVRALGAYHPFLVNQLVCCVGQAVGAGRLPRAEGLALVASALNDQLGWRERHRARVLLAATRRNDRAAFAGTEGCFRRRWPPAVAAGEASGIVVVVAGIRSGRPLTLLRRTGPGGLAGHCPSMSTLFGQAAAAFVHLALSARPAGGAFAPEAWVSPVAFHRAFAEAGAAPGLLEPVAEQHGRFRVLPGLLTTQCGQQVDSSRRGMVKIGSKPLASQLTALAGPRL